LDGNQGEGPGFAVSTKGKWKVDAGETDVQVTSAESSKTRVHLAG